MLGKKILKWIKTSSIDFRCQVQAPPEICDTYFAKLKAYIHYHYKWYFCINCWIWIHNCQCPYYICSIICPEHKCGEGWGRKKCMTTNASSRTRLLPSFRFLATWRLWTKPHGKLWRRKSIHEFWELIKVKRAVRWS